jgi:two-component system, NarL family, invasion response regulator UvrY
MTDCALFYVDPRLRKYQAKMASEPQAISKNNDLRILIVDDHDVVRVGFRQILTEHSRFRVTGEANCAKQAFELLRKETFDIVLLDLSLPDGSGVDILRKIRERYPDTKVLMLSGFAEEQYGVNMLRAGAAGFLSKTCTSEQLTSAIETIAIGRRYISPKLAEILAEGLNAPTDKPVHEQLSEREFQIFCRLSEGKTVSEIAESLFISVKTVSTYRARLLEKMGLKTNSELTYYALKNGLIQ